MLTIEPLRAEWVAPLNDHIARHRQETGRHGDLHFMPFAPDSSDGPKGIDPNTWQAPLSEPGWQRWFVAWRAAEQLVGHIDLKSDGLRTGLHRCELGVGIERAFRGQGLGRRLMRTAIDFGQAETSLDWIDLRVFAHNSAARALYRSLGFTEIGTYHDRFRIAGQAIDDVLMTLAVS